MFRKLLLALPLLALTTGASAWADEFNLPGLGGDARRYLGEIQRRNPAAQGNPQSRQQAEQRALAAERTNNWAAAATAWEDRIAAGDVTADQWQALARAQLRRQPPEAERALQAAWNAFGTSDAGPAEIPALLLIIDALGRLDRPVQLVQAWQAVLERAPDDAGYRDRLAAARRAAGVLVQSVSVDNEAEPARACLSFTVPPSHRQDWQPADWIRTEPAVPDLVVTREGDALCLAGFPYGRTTSVTLRAGMPGEDGLKLNRDAVVPVTTGNRSPRIVFDNRRYVLPRGQAPRVAVTTVNLSSLKLQVLRVGERGLVALRNDWRLGDGPDDYTAGSLSDTAGRVVWEGRADIPNFRQNETRRTALPLPDAVRAAGPGLFVLVARPGDGTSSDEGSLVAALPVISTDLGLVAWRGADGVAVQARSLSDARARAGVRVTLLARNNDILAEATTDADGLVRFPAPVLRGDGAAAPVSIHAETGDGAASDLAQLDLDTAAFDLSDRGATGQPVPGPVDAFLWSDRGIYRPGETVQVAALLRDGAGMPLATDLPVRLRLRRPNGQVFAEAVPERGNGGAIFWPVSLSRTAQAGQWTLEALTDPDAAPIATANLRVDAFVPEALAVTLGPAPGPLVPGTTLNVPVNTRYLYGAPGAGLGGSATLRLAVEQEPFPEWKGWQFGQVGESFAPDLQSIDLPPADDAGNATLALSLPRAPDTTHPLRAEVQLEVAQPDGRSTRAALTVPVRPTGTLVAIRPGFADGAVDENAEAAFDVAAVSPDGKALAAPLRLRLVRERPSFRLVVRGSLARYETVFRDEPVDAAEISPAPGKPAHYARRLPFGRYRLDVADPKGLGISSVRFRSGWAATADDADVPDRVEVSTDRQGYAPGDTARLRVQPPFAGRATVAVLTDRLISVREVDLPAGGSEVTVPVETGWGPGAHVAVTVFRPGEAQNGQPARALGLAWVGLDPAARRLEVAIEGPQRVVPRTRVEVPVRVAPPAGQAGGETFLTLAAVDEGVLHLTDFRTPDPTGHYLGRRRLGLDIRDDYGRIIPPADGDAVQLRQGGDDMGGLAGIDIPQRVVALFSGPVSVGADGRATVPLDIPDFAGELRLMAVAWSGNRVGASARPLTVRDPVVAQALLPRFLAPGDEQRLSVLLHNVDLPAGTVTAEISATGAVALGGPAQLSANLAAGAQAIPSTTLRATGSGEGVIRLVVTGPNNFRAEHESRITVRSSRGTVTETASVELPPGRDTPIALPTERFLPGTWKASATFGGPVRFDPAALLRAMEDYPYFCVEQAGSRVLALATVPEEGIGGADRLVRLNRAVSFVLDRQRYDGSFALWSAQGEEQPWLTAFATEALLRAQASGATVPQAPLDQALAQIAAAVEQADTDTPEGRADQAYRLHVLSLAGRPRLGAARRLLEQLDQLPTPLAKAQLGAAFVRAGDAERGTRAFAAALDMPARRPWVHDYGSAARDNLAVALLLEEAAVLPDRRTAVLARLPSRELTPDATSTQEQGWAVATAAVLGRNGLPTRVAIDGRVLPEQPIVSLALTAPTTVRNSGSQPVWQSVSVTGIPATPLPAGRSGMRITRRFLDEGGNPLNLDDLHQNTSFVLLIEGSAETGEAHHALLQQGLPAGWEIAARLSGGEVTGMPWLGTLSSPAATPALDDRYAAAVDLTPDEKGFRLAVRLRAVTPGRYELPGAEVSDMYRPAVFARQNTGMITVLPPR
ncbi:alpha-2-macroglobulin family protein [Roseomonas elaeocarpi]|uniref:Alpha-2-macroglobulin n=1 Tax=Roseomonas elaeocarpi TaxID=907779 RepID=A0ABV6JLW2_9PROT